MAFKIEELMVSVTVEDKGQAVMRLEGCGDPTIEVLFASCGKTQIVPCNPNQGHAANVAYVPSIEHLQALRQELQDALDDLATIEAALEVPASDTPSRRTLRLNAVRGGNGSGAPQDSAG